MPMHYTASRSTIRLNLALHCSSVANESSVMGGSSSTTSTYKAKGKTKYDLYVRSMETGMPETGMPVKSDLETYLEVGVYIYEEKIKEEAVTSVVVAWETPLSRWFFESLSPSPAASFLISLTPKSQLRDRKVTAAKEVKAWFEECFKIGNNRWFFFKLWFLGEIQRAGATYYVIQYGSSEPHEVTVHTRWYSEVVPHEKAINSR
ncbi:hypothetical protein RJ640_000797 [Escallonia rubra]|uniref:Uncharacterized protein n=1 Tax=Escallonia rubra TaxID=112253 RepID=A0AA88U9U1_9ASTE|nr:hypothetical protein RJ640_000797 [Escallonia rubra]